MLLITNYWVKINSFCKQNDRPFGKLDGTKYIGYEKTKHLTKVWPHKFAK